MLKGKKNSLGECDKEGVYTGSLLPSINEIKKKLTAFFKSRPRREELEDKGILPKQTAQHKDSLTSSDVALTKSVKWSPQLENPSSALQPRANGNSKNNTVPKGENVDGEKRWREEQLQEMRLLDKELAELNSELNLIEQKLDRTNSGESERTNSEESLKLRGSTSPPNSPSNRTPPYLTPCCVNDEEGREKEKEKEQQRDTGNGNESFEAGKGRDKSGYKQKGKAKRKRRKRKKKEGVESMGDKELKKDEGKGERKGDNTSKELQDTANKHEGRVNSAKGKKSGDLMK